MVEADQQARAGFMSVHTPDHPPDSASTAEVARDMEAPRYPLTDELLNDT